MKIVVVIIVNPVEPCNLGMDGTVSNWKFTHMFLKQSTIAKCMKVATYNRQPENCYHSDTQEAGK